MLVFLLKSGKAASLNHSAIAAFVEVLTRSDEFQDEIFL
jgi:hypothetical protein